MRTYVGVDPGKTGCMAVIRSEELFEKIQSPLIVFWDAEDLSLRIVSENLQLWQGNIFVLLEKPQVMPKRKQWVGGELVEKEVGQGAVGMLHYGIGYGKYLGMLEALKIPYGEIHPMSWKKEFMLIKQPKERSIEVARQLFPSAAERLTRKKDHGRAEALLIAEYARRRNM
jgi:crossover junction endodeoxyribonuclease RuvC